MARPSRLIALALAVLTGIAPASAANASIGGDFWTTAAGTSSTEHALEGPEAVAQPVTSMPRVGAIFFPSLVGSAVLLGLPHMCSGSVVDSPRRDVVLTAAHCVAGTGLGYDFAPGYQDGKTPYGTWTVLHAYIDPAWKATRDPQHDYAFLVVAARSWHGVRSEIEDVTGGFPLGSAPASGSTATISGYVTGVGDRALSCASSVYYTQGYPTIDCDGFAAGTSGGPWIQDGSVVGVIGGLHQGGCFAATSYSSAFGPDTVADLGLASTGARPDVVPLAGSDGC